jgi:hypothetical protein
MKNDKGKSPDEDFDKIINGVWDFAREHGGKSWDLFTMAVLIKSIERLKVSTEESSRQANRLSKTIRNLTRALVWLTAIAVVLTGFSIYVLLHSAK